MTANCSLLLPDRSLRPLVQRWLSDIPAGRLAEVTDLRAAVVYLASDAWEYMTEHNLVIQGASAVQSCLLLCFRQLWQRDEHRSNALLTEYLKHRHRERRLARSYNE
ncbi:uncharacterized protein [Nerophis lumbriciformis]|uniref:uncharacterized protein isoform X1 n=1 Tax=Nerophis lumbriciformis TaxID=546530 RepID=UPI003BA85764